MNLTWAEASWTLRSKCAACPRSSKNRCCQFVGQLQNNTTKKPEINFTHANLYKNKHIQGFFTFEISITLNGCFNFWHRQGQISFLKNVQKRANEKYFSNHTVNIYSLTYLLHPFSSGTFQPTSGDFSTIWRFFHRRFSLVLRWKRNGCCQQNHNYLLNCITGSQNISRTQRLLNLYLQYKIRFKQMCSLIEQNTFKHRHPKTVHSAAPGIFAPSFI